MFGQIYIGALWSRWVEHKIEQHNQQYFNFLDENWGREYYIVYSNLCFFYLPKLAFFLIDLQKLFEY